MAFWMNKMTDFVYDEFGVCCAKIVANQVITFSNNTLIARSLNESIYNLENEFVGYFDPIRLGLSQNDISRKFFEILKD